MTRRPRLALVVFVALASSCTPAGGSPPPRSVSQEAIARTDAAQAEPFTWELLRNTPYSPGHVSSLLVARTGEEVTLTGFMLPGGMDGEEYVFLLVENSFGCCFGQPPEINHIVQVRAKLSRPWSDYVGPPLKVIGHFSASEERYQGQVISLYRIADATLEIVTS